MLFFGVSLIPAGIIFFSSFYIPAAILYVFLYIGLIETLKSFPWKKSKMSGASDVCHNMCKSYFPFKQILYREKKSLSFKFSFLYILLYSWICFIFCYGFIKYIKFDIRLIPPEAFVCISVILTGIIFLVYVLIHFDNKKFPLTFSGRISSGKFFIPKYDRFLLFPALFSFSVIAVLLASYYINIPGYIINPTSLFIYLFIRYNMRILKAKWKLTSPLNILNPNVIRIEKPFKTEITFSLKYRWTGFFKWLNKFIPLEMAFILIFARLFLAVFDVYVYYPFGASRGVMWGIFIFIITICSFLYGGRRGEVFNSFLDSEYMIWLLSVPWSYQKKLPLGSPLISYQDFSVYLFFAILLYPYTYYALFILPVIMFIPYSLISLNAFAKLSSTNIMMLINFGIILFPVGAGKFIYYSLPHVKSILRGSEVIAIHSFYIFQYYLIFLCVPLIVIYLIIYKAVKEIKKAAPWDINSDGFKCDVYQFYIMNTGKLIKMSNVCRDLFPFKKIMQKKQNRIRFNDVLPKILIYCWVIFLIDFLILRHTSISLKRFISAYFGYFVITLSFCMYIRYCIYFIIENICFQ